MIYYFSATGNSLWAAKELSKAFGEPAIDISEELKERTGELVYPLREGEKIFFVYPVHSWGPAVLVKRFISRLKFKNYCRQEVYSICTCGSDCAYTDHIIRHDLEQRKIRLSACYSISMPNTYILMKGFDTDGAFVEQQKLRQAPRDLHRIIQVIQGLHLSKPLYQHTGFPNLKSSFIYPAFLRFVIGKNAFHATDKCLSCGFCEKICPTGTIQMINGKPQWADTCVQCTACIHRCPVRAIEYGKVTKKKGRYHHPDIK